MQKIRFEKTCDSCPEQYDIISTAHSRGFEVIPDRKVGYIRLRCGKLRVYYPDENGEKIYEHTFNDEMKGCFDNDEERGFFLKEISDVIFNKMEELNV